MSRGTNDDILRGGNQVAISPPKVKIFKLGSVWVIKCGVVSTTRTQWFDAVSVAPTIFKWWDHEYGNAA